MKKALLLVDLQNDFCPGGALAVDEGDRVIAVANRAIEACMAAGVTVIATQDWHPENHGCFAVNANTKIGEIGELNGWPQIWWPIHCVQGTTGADFHPALNQSAIQWIIQKGTQPEIDSYSAFFDNGHRVKTELDDWLHANHITHLTILGLATDYCVKFSVWDAIALGYHTEVLVDGCRGLNLSPDDSESALREMAQRGATLTDMAEFLASLPSAR
ncbi:bifunctional nicotinamidase/pyrazinamidase [Pectobacterium aroidearum]|jgi:nicotinamidase/pyrazinamidase|uniref:Nicotinamidase n=1 Tax=Pectobacterium aroidearum TaxID=1201031 RepID=A0AAW3SQ71_9GAMM|nr:MULTISPECIES: bifunctional nicotinamidase/pyrazinamidase [Pectobacterium]MBA0203239.1 bifunctional nicotinamidase/pyrazinamidase [Pectobacterium aroidearum]MBA5198180.1 bifunctional nicotinamidase/pyrazinamidase [Pectobacterium aroidearum]MBA5203779.1 bifunctional nicotinamidase/pyrazinamidase [Pectobacterium aroidearum]MBA5227316.1 bifunctional nicotinamidase/pyrazinamidase [Pectobacterium aroidearum]MBA5230973.1 bifunctional nicotinamidase/pyrazinamidase [Pectobacterium aroidearum]